VTKSPIPTWLAHLRRRFSPGLLRLGADGARTLASGGNAGVLALVGRELCLYLDVDTSKVSPRQRAGYVATLVRRAAPFADPDHDVLWLQGRASVWYWSRERVRGVAGTGPGIRFRAEALYRGDIPAGDADQLLVLDDDGVEARIWRQGRLRASRWWSAPPDAATWQAFARGAGLDARSAPPESVAAPLRRTPLSGTQQRLGLASGVAAYAPLLSRLAGTVVVALLAWQATGLFRAMWETQRVERQIGSLGARLDKIITAREQADSAQARIDALLGLRPPASQTRLLGEVKRLTPGNWQLVSWTLTDGEVLEATLKTDTSDPAGLVAAWEASPLLEAVTPATSNTTGALALQARVTPLRQQLP
jgi:hypothetical protein